MHGFILSVYILSLVALGFGHTWVEQLSREDDIYFEHVGYPRGNVFRNTASFLEQHDATMTHLLPLDGLAVNDTEFMCMGSQQNPNQTQSSPALSVPPGARIILRYQENGHVTLTNNTPWKASPGQVYIYGTQCSEPSDTFTAIHLVWNQVGDGGDGRGRLLSQEPFDDGMCYAPTGSTLFEERRQIFEPDHLQGSNRWCRNEVDVSSDVRGRYTLYWVWDWPSISPTGQIMHNEIYTTCMDVFIQDFA